MRCRQTKPERWLIINQKLDQQHWDMLFALPRGSGILLLHAAAAPELRRIRALAQRKGHVLARDRRDGVHRVHNLRELTKSLFRRPRLLLISPIYATTSHPDWRPLPRMRAATLARLGGRNALALGGMDMERYRRFAALGFAGWAGISAFRT